MKKYPKTKHKKMDIPFLVMLQTQMTAAIKQVTFVNITIWSSFKKKQQSKSN